MTITAIYKHHTIASGDEKGVIVRFDVVQRQKDGKYLVRKPGHTTNKDEDYYKRNTLDEVEADLAAGLSCRMKREDRSETNTLTGEGRVVIG